MQLYDIESISQEDFGYSPQAIVDVLRQQSFVQAGIRLHSALTINVPMSAVQVKDILRQSLDTEVLPGKNTFAFFCCHPIFFVSPVLTVLGLKPEGGQYQSALNLKE